MKEWLLVEVVVAVAVVVVVGGGGVVVGVVVVVVVVVPINPQDQSTFESFPFIHSLTRGMLGSPVPSPLEATLQKDMVFRG